MTEQEQQALIDAINKKNEELMQRIWQTCESLDESYDVTMRCFTQAVIMELLDLAKLKGVTLDEEVQQFCEIIKMALKPRSATIIQMVPTD
jgi:hypothetical protein